MSNAPMGCQALVIARKLVGGGSLDFCSSGYFNKLEPPINKVISLQIPRISHQFHQPLSKIESLGSAPPSVHTEKTLLHTTAYGPGGQSRNVCLPPAPAMVKLIGVYKDSHNPDGIWTSANVCLFFSGKPSSL